MGKSSENSPGSLQASHSSCQLISNRVELMSSKFVFEKSRDLNDDERKSGGCGSIG